MICLDHNATTPLLAPVLEAMLPFFAERYGNASSRHPLGLEARRAVERARTAAADFIGARDSEIVFTSGGTESVALAFGSGLSSASVAIVNAAEHACVLDTAQMRARLGFRVETLPVDAFGVVEPAELDRALASASGGAFVSIILVNNETGVITPMEEIAQVCARHGALLHVDAVQAVGKVDINVARLGCHYLSVSGHKFNAPKGSGFLFVRRDAPRFAWIAGHQERGMRGGTENTPAIVGLHAALDLLANWPAESRRQRSLRDALEAGILERVAGTEVNARGAARVSNTSSIYFPDRNAADLVAALGNAGVCVSAGAACTTGGEPSHVLLAMGCERRRANGTLRFSLGVTTSEDHIRTAIEVVGQTHAAMLPTWEAR